MENSVQFATLDKTLDIPRIALKDKPPKESYITSEIRDMLQRTKSDIFDRVIHSKNKMRTGPHFWRVDDQYGRWGVNQTAIGSTKSVSFINTDRSLPISLFKAWTNGHNPIEMYAPHFKFLDNPYKHDITIELQNGNQYFIDEDLDKIVMSEVIVTNPIYPPGRTHERTVRTPQIVSEEDKPIILQSLVLVSLFCRDIPIKHAS